MVAPRPSLPLFAVFNAPGGGCFRLHFKPFSPREKDLKADDNVKLLYIPGRVTLFYDYFR